MKVKDLKELLNKIPEDFEVVMSSDSEGNSYSPAASYSLHMYRPDSTWSGELVDREELEGGDYKQNCVVIWPTN